MLHPAKSHTVSAQFLYLPQSEWLVLINRKYCYYPIDFVRRAVLRARLPTYQLARVSTPHPPTPHTPRSAVERGLVIEARREGY